METTPTTPGPDDPRTSLAAADQARTALADGLRLPVGLHAVIAAAVAVQIGAGAYGIAAQTVTGLAVALAGMVVFAGVAALSLSWFKRMNGVRVDGLASQIVLGTGALSTAAYVAALGAATWAAFAGSWWLVAAAAVAGGGGYALGTHRWWHAYRQDPAAHAAGASPRVLGALAVVACVGLVALVVLG